MFVMNRKIVISGLLAVALSISAAHGAVIHMASGLSGINTPVSFRAELTINANLLTIELFNDSAQSLAPDDILGSYYFDIVNDSNVRPTLTYLGAAGDVWLTSRTNPDALSTPSANLKAVNAGDFTWQFRGMNAGLAPFLGFGVGTVGNSNLSPNNFNGNIVDGMDYAIYAGDVTTQNLNNRLLVKDSITFTFSGVEGFTEADISSLGTFGMGTAPDSLLSTPEPTTCMLLLSSMVGIVAKRRRIA